MSQVPVELFTETSELYVVKIRSILNFEKFQINLFEFSHNVFEHNFKGLNRVQHLSLPIFHVVFSLFDRNGSSQK